MRPTIGRIVLYTVSEYDGVVSDRPLRCSGAARAAVVVQDWGGTNEDVNAHPNLRVLLDGSNDGGVADLWVTSAPYDASGKPGTWRWPPKII